MENLQTKIQQLLEIGGFREPSVRIDSETRKVEIFVNEGEWFKKWLPSLVTDFDHLIRLFAKKHDTRPFFVDVNSYRRERERIIVDIANAAARKASLEKSEIKLPSMNAYERRLIHVALAIHPEVKTESEGEGKTRCVIIRPIV